MSAEDRGFIRGDFSGGGGGEDLGLGRRFNARISLMTRTLTIKKPKAIATLFILNIIALSEYYYRDSSNALAFQDFSFTSEGVGRFRAKEGAKPHIGTIGKLEEVIEERIETICPKGNAKKAVEEIKKAHPYEEPSIDVYPLLNL